MDWLERTLEQQKGIVLPIILSGYLALAICVLLWLFSRRKFKQRLLDLEGKARKYEAVSMYGAFTQDYELWLASPFRQQAIQNQKPLEAAVTDFLVSVSPTEYVAVLRSPAFLRVVQLETKHGESVRKSFLHASGQAAKSALPTSDAVIHALYILALTRDNVAPTLAEITNVAQDILANPNPY